MAAIITATTIDTTPTVDMMAATATAAAIPGCLAYKTLTLRGGWSFSLILNQVL